MKIVNTLFVLAVFVIGYVAGSYAPINFSSLAFTNISPSNRNTVDKKSTPTKLTAQFNKYSDSFPANTNLDCSKSLLRKNNVLPCSDQLLQQNQVEAATTLLTHHLEQYYDDASTWLKLASIYKSISNQSGYIDALLNHAEYENNLDNFQKSVLLIKNQLLKRYSKLSASSNFNEKNILIIQLEKISKLAPTDTDILWVLAKLWHELGNIDQAQYYALASAADPNKKKNAEELIALINKSINMDQHSKNIDDQIIPLKAYHNQFLVDVEIDNTPATFLLDTGASLSGVSQSFTVLHSHIATNSKTITLQTAAGTTIGSLFTAKSVTLGESNYHDQSMVIFPTGSFDGFDGLLGIDILGQFDFYIDQTGPWLYLQKKHAK